MKARYSSAFLFFVAFSYVQSVQAQQVHKLSVQQAVEYARKNNVQVKNALIALKTQEQVNREITAAAYPQLNGSMGANFNPNVTVQQFPNFIAAATYGVLEAEGVKKRSTPWLRRSVLSIAQPFVCLPSSGGVPRF